MDLQEELKFNQQIIQAFKVKVDNSDKRIGELEKNLKVKETELLYLTKKYDLDFTTLSSETQSAKVKISELESQLKKSNKNLSVKEENLKKIEAELNKLTPLKDEISKLNNNLEPTKKEISTLTSQIDELNKFLIQKEAKIKELNENVLEKENLFKEQSDRLKSLESELAALKPVETETQKSEERERLICPKCGAFGKDIKTEENKSKILGYAGHIPIYAKNNVCKKCGQVL